MVKLNPIKLSTKDKLARAGLQNDPKAETETPAVDPAQDAALRPGPYVPVASPDHGGGGKDPVSDPTAGDLPVIPPKPPRHFDFANDLGKPVANND
jgi:hypothetical protein